MKINASELKLVYNEIPSYIAKIMIDTYDMEMNSGEYSNKTAMKHAKDAAIEELEFGFDFTKDVTDKILNNILEELFHSHYNY